MDDVRGDLVSVLSGLESHWAVLEAEIRELNADIANTEACLNKYGEIFRLPLQHLKQLKRAKKNAMKDIVANLENLSANLEGGRKLLKNLAKNNNHANLVIACDAPMPKQSSNVSSSVIRAVDRR
eukprot:ANDGO_07937.mRNA.1 hypothetical protein